MNHKKILIISGSAVLLILVILLLTKTFGTITPTRDGFIAVHGSSDIPSHGIWHNNLMTVKLYQEVFTKNTESWYKYTYILVDFKDSAKAIMYTEFKDYSNLSESSINLDNNLFTKQISMDVPKLNVSGTRSIVYRKDNFDYMNVRLIFEKIPTEDGKLKPFDVYIIGSDSPHLEITDNMWLKKFEVGN